MLNINRKIVLGSGSPRRKELLEQMGLDFEIMKSDKEEIIEDSLTPAEVVRSLALQKAEDIVQRVDKDTILITADTIVECEGRILGKPIDEEDAFGMLKFISNKRHSVFTGVVVWDTKDDTKKEIVERTTVYIKNITDDEAWAYIRIGEPMDKAGSYGIQGKGAVLIEKIEGDYYSVMGLPVNKLYEILKCM